MQDWPVEEAAAEAEHFLATVSEYNPDENHQRVIKLRQHWIKVFGATGQGVADMKQFSTTFNAAIEGKFDKYI